MHIEVINHQLPGLFNSLIVPEQHAETANWIAQQFTDTAVNYLTDAGRAMMERAKQAYDQVKNSNIEMMTRKVIRGIHGVFNQNIIMPMNSYSDLQLAKPVMQRYLMAMPEIRNIYHRQLCDGYSDSYVDFHPKDVGESHYDYRRVMDGIVQEVTNEDGSEGWTVTCYQDDLVPTDRDLDVIEQSIILDSWSLMRSAIRNGVDPTDLYNGELEV